MSNRYTIITCKNRIFKFKADSLEDALNNYIEAVLGFDVNFSIKKEYWNTINRFIKPIDTKIGFLNELCKIPANKISQIILESTSYPFANDDAIKYSLSEDYSHASVDGHEDDIVNALISASYDGIPVTTINEGAFKNCTSLESVTIPNSVTTINGGVFEHCTSLTSVTIGNGVTSIGNGAFSGCTNLTNVIIPNSIATMDSYVFWGCTGLTSITLPFIGASLDGTGKAHFGYIFGAADASKNNKYVPASLKEVIITAPCNIIGNNAFKGCANIESILIPDSVTSLGNSAFMNCTSLENITIPNNITKINLSAFCGCTSLTSITIPDSVTSIDDLAFSYCNSLTSITIPNSVISIGDGTFDGCSNLQKIEVPNKISIISQNLFKDCVSLQEVILPASISIIQSGAFDSCPELTTINYAGTVPQWQSIIIESNNQYLNSATIRYNYESLV